MIYLLGISADDYERENKKTRPTNGRIFKRTRLPTMVKTKRHSCSQCPSNDASKFAISEKEVRWLCPNCVQKALRKNDKEKPHFVRGSQLR